MQSSFEFPGTTDQDLKNSGSRMVEFADSVDSKVSGNLLRLFIKTNEYIYARPNDILMIESADHMVKVHVAIGKICKKVYRHNTLKQFLTHLPAPQFIRVGRFYAINTMRLSAGNSKLQTFEFDFCFTIKIEHSLPNAVFTCIGK